MNVPSKKKSVLIFSCFYKPFEGGAERYVVEIVERLKAKYNFVILTSRLSRGLARSEHYSGVDIYRLGIGLKIDKYLFPFLAPLRALFLRKELVHAVLASYAGLALCFYNILDRKTPTLLTLQSGKIRMPRFLFKIVHRCPNIIQAVSQSLADRAKFFGAKNVVVIPNGVDLKRFDVSQNSNEYDNMSDMKEKRIKIRKKIGIDNNDFLVITVARLEKVKGIEYLIRAMAEIKKYGLGRYNDDTANNKNKNRMNRIMLVVIGDGTERNNLEELTGNLRLNDIIKFLGWVSNEDVPFYLTAADCFVLPSLSEGFGIAIIEAQAIGLPVIASKVGGIPDIIKDRENGILVRPGNSGDIARAILDIYNQPSVAKKIIKNANKTVNRYDWEKIVQEIDKIYIRLISGNF